MKRIKKLLLVLSLLTTGCVYSNVTVPLDDDVNRTEFGTKTGKARSHMVAFLVSWGDAGTKAAAENGEIQVVTHLDSKYYSVLFGLYSFRETIAYGY